MNCIPWWAPVRLKGLWMQAIFKPMLARGELHCIGATTLDEYRKHIEKDAALERRFRRLLWTSRQWRIRYQFCGDLRNAMKCIMVSRINGFGSW